MVPEQSAPVLLDRADKAGAVAREAHGALWVQGFLLEPLVEQWLGATKSPRGAGTLELRLEFLLLSLGSEEAAEVEGRRVSEDLRLVDETQGGHRVCQAEVGEKERSVAF